MAEILDDFKKEEQRRKLEELKNKALSLGKKAYEFGMEHKRETAGVALGLASGARCLYKRHVRKEEERWRNRSFYDRSTGQYYMTRKDVSQAQHLQIEARRRNGEPLGQILASMRLL